MEAIEGSANGPIDCHEASHTVRRVWVIAGLAQR
jgi:hypothetical protein